MFVLSLNEFTKCLIMTTYCFNQTSKFCRLKEALDVDWTSDKAKAALKRTPVDYFLLHGTHLSVFYDGISDTRHQSTFLF